uniref:Transcriptional regulator, XRE family n=1 Tax=Geobacter sp. (strain M21) TaxID=443144 RepID=C6E4Y5_GEOSM
MGDVVSSAEIGTLIRRYRQDAGLSQEKLAEMVGVSFQQIQKYENGHTTLNIIKLQHIAAALKVAVTDFFDAAPVKGVRLTGEEDQLLQAFRKVKSGELRGCILKLVDNVNKRTK